MRHTQRSAARGGWGSGFRFARVAGVDIAADWSLAIIFLLVFFNLGAAVFPAWHPGWSAGLAWGMALAAAILLFVSITVHELSHALVARAQSIPVRRITLFVFGGMAHMEGEPPRPRAELLMAGVGPVTSLLIGALALFGASLAMPPIDPTAIDDPAALLRQMGPGTTLAYWLGTLNIMLGLFNLVPGFPLDGGRVLRAALWWGTGSFVKATRWAANGGRAFALLLMAAGVAMMFGVWVPLLGTGFGQGLWLVLIGWFLNSAAMTSYRQLILRENLAGVHVGDLMVTHPAVVTPNLTLDTVVREYVLGTDQQVFPVLENDQVVGVLSLGDIREVQPSQRSSVPVRAAMKPGDEATTARPEDDVLDALAKARFRSGELPVVQGGHLEGLLRQQDVAKWLILHESNERAAL